MGIVASTYGGLMKVPPIFLLLNVCPYFIERPVWLSKLKSQTIKEGTAAEFVCELNHPGMNVDWYVNNRRASALEHCDGSQEGKIHKLTISDVQISDEGDVKACFRNLNTEAELFVEGLFLLYIYIYLKFVSKVKIHLICRVQN